jgi:hypothetical protein
MSKKPYLLLFLILFCGKATFAQTPPAWAGGADQNDLSFGFSFAYVSDYYKILKNTDWRTPVLDKDNGNRPATSALNSITSPNSAGFAIGFITRYRITDHLEVRTTPSLIFADRELYYSFQDPSQSISKNVQSTTIDAPLLLKLKSDRIGNFRGYIVGGLKYSYSIGANKPDPQDALIDKTVKNVSAYESYEVGIGCDIYFEYFKLSPEIKISNSINNMLIPEYQPYATPINKLFLHSLMFSLYFE